MPATLKTYSFLLNFGYAEDGGLGYVPFVSKKKFASAKDAFIDLANFFKDAFLIKEVPVVKPCCEKSKTINPDSDFCGKCKSPLGDYAFDDEAYTDFVRMIGGSDNNSYCGDIVDWDDEARWQSKLPKDLSKVQIVYVAEKSLAAALGYSSDDRVDIDSIFKNQSKTNSFSFW
jgi:hypothetical protein